MRNYQNNDIVSQNIDLVQKTTRNSVEIMTLSQNIDFACKK